MSRVYLLIEVTCTVYSYDLFELNKTKKKSSTKKQKLERFFFTFNSVIWLNWPDALETGTSVYKCVDWLNKMTKIELWVKDYVLWYEIQWVDGRTLQMLYQKFTRNKNVEDRTVRSFAARTEPILSCNPIQCADSLYTMNLSAQLQSGSLHRYKYTHRNREHKRYKMLLLIRFLFSIQPLLHFYVFVYKQFQHMEKPRACVRFSLFFLLL